MIISKVKCDKDLIKAVRGREDLQVFVASRAHKSTFVIIHTPAARRLLFDDGVDIEVLDSRNFIEYGLDGMDPVMQNLLFMEKYKVSLN